jgi:hypothetical protein
MNEEPIFWSSWEGRILRAIAIDGVKTRYELRKTTGLDTTQFEMALDELLEGDFIFEEEQDKYRITSDELCNQYRSFSEKSSVSKFRGRLKYRRVS